VIQGCYSLGPCIIRDLSRGSGGRWELFPALRLKPYEKTGFVIVYKQVAPSPGL
jgi:hypothetical protein